MDVNAKDDNGFTALHYASQSGLMKCVEYLLAHGADPLTENKSGLTPCDMARLKGHHDIATFLESKMVPGETPGKIFISKSRKRRSAKIVFVWILLLRDWNVSWLFNFDSVEKRFLKFYFLHPPWSRITVNNIFVRDRIGKLVRWTPIFEFWPSGDIFGT